MAESEDEFASDSEAGLELAPDFPQEEIREKFKKIDPDIAEKFKIKKSKFAMSMKQRDGLLETARCHSFTHELMIETQLLTGIRVSELTNLLVDDVNLGAKEIYIRPHKGEGKIDPFTTKTVAGQRTVPIPDQLVSKLSGYIKAEKRKLGYFFISRKKGAFARESVIGFINKYARETKNLKKNIGSHAMRRTFATFMVTAGHSIMEVSKLLGHASYIITLRYLYEIEDAELHDKVRETQAKMITWKDKR